MENVTPQHDSDRTMVGGMVPLALAKQFKATAALRGEKIQEALEHAISMYLETEN